MQKPLLVPVTGILANESVRKRTISVHYRTVGVVCFFGLFFVVALVGLSLGWVGLNIGERTLDLPGIIV